MFTANVRLLDAAECGRLPAPLVLQLPAGRGLVTYCRQARAQRPLRLDVIAQDAGAAGVALDPGSRAGSPSYS